MSYQRPAAETTGERAARKATRVYGERWRETAELHLGEIAKRIMFDLDDAVSSGNLPNGLRFAILGRRDHLIIDVFGLIDDEVSLFSDFAERAVVQYAAAYNYSNPIAAWDMRFTLTVRVLSETEQFDFRNARGAIDIRHYPY